MQITERMSDVCFGNDHDRGGQLTQHEVAGVPHDEIRLPPLEDHSGQSAGESEVPDGDRAGR